MKSYALLAAAIAFAAPSIAQPAVAGGRRIIVGPPVCWNPPDAVWPGYVPCSPYTGLHSPRRVDGSFGVHSDDWFYDRPVSILGTMTGSSDPGTPPSWNE